ncbi:multicopper oxidase family protein [Roseivivax sp. CAU 1761]
MFTRRQTLAGLAAAGLLPALPRIGAAATAAADTLRLAPSQHQIAPADYPATALWTVEGAFPGPELRLAQGARLSREVINDLPDPTSLHWHGIRIDNTMDGVPGVTQPPIPPGGRFRYDFALPDAGTYWYHSHLQSTEQVERGLYGPLIVTEAEPPEVDHDITLMLDDIRLGDRAELLEDFDNAFDRSHGGRIGNVPLTNGAFAWERTVARGDRLRLRLVNAATARIFSLGLQGLEGWQVALDGMPLAAPEALPETLVLGPAQRVDLIVDVTAEAGEDALLVSLERDGGYAQAVFQVEAGSAARRPAPAALPPNEVYPIDLAATRNAAVLMEGGAMRGLSEATLDGTRLGGRELAQQGFFWALNGIAGRPAEPLLTVSRGDSVRLGLANDTAFPHAMHLHGMHFSEVLPGGGLGPLRDTLLVAAGETREIAFAAHNPGDWLFHCHMLAHHAGGMGTWIRVTG